MTFRLSGIAAFILGSACALPAFAQNFKPGLWALATHAVSPDSQTQAAIGQLQQQMAGMDPAQRKVIEQMMAKQGIELGGSADGTIHVKTCVTPEMAARNEVPVQQHGDCTSTHSPAAGGVMAVSFACTHPRASGRGELSFTGDTAYRMKLNVTSDVSGREEAIILESTAKWLGADCGRTRPLAPPATD